MRASSSLRRGCMMGYTGVIRGGYWHPNAWRMRGGGGGSIAAGILLSGLLVRSWAAEAQRATGVKRVVNKEGTGVSPKKGQVCEMHYTGKLENGKVFDSSIGRGTFKVKKSRRGIVYLVGDV